MRILVASLFLTASVTAAAAQSGKCEVKVESDKFTADLNAKTGAYSGNVVVTQCDMKMRADMVRLNTTNGQLDRVTATGNVVVDSAKAGVVTGGSGVYDVLRRVVTMSGNVVLKRGKDVMRGPQLTVNIATGQATLGGGTTTTVAAGAQQPQNTRVQAVFSPATAGQ